MGGSKDFFTKGIFTYTAVAEVAGLKILKGTGVSITFRNTRTEALHM